MTSIIEQIREAEAQLPALNETARRTHAEAMEDGEISPDEQRKIDTIDGKISNLRDMVQRLRDEWQRNKDNYTQMRDAMSGPMAAASVCEYEILSADQEAIIAADTATNASAGAEDFADALVKGGELEQLLADFQTRLELIEEQRAEYEPALAALQPRLDQYSQSTPELAYADALMSDLVTTQGEMETAATSGDYENALRLLSDLTAKLDEIDAAIEAKKAEYTEQRSAFDSRLSEVSAEVYVDIGAERDALAESASAMDTAAAAEDWQTALDLANQGLVDCESYHALVTEQQAFLAQIETNLPAQVAAANELSDATSAKKATADQLITSITQAMNNKEGLAQAIDDLAEVATLLAEVEVIYDVRTQLDGAAAEDRDDIARSIVEAAEFNITEVPTEARNLLVEALMSGDSVEDNEHDAIAEIWSEEDFVDREFDNVESEVRERIVDAIANDPTVVAMARDWDTYTDEEKREAYERLAAIPADEWGIDAPPVSVRDEPWEDNGDGTRSITLGSYSPSSDTMWMNVSDDAEAHGDFASRMGTLVHEIGHKYQEHIEQQYRDGTLEPDDPEYQQARSHFLDDEYQSQYPAQFGELYRTSPDEAHSRNMGHEMQEAMERALAEAEARAAAEEPGDPGGTTGT